MKRLALTILVACLLAGAVAAALSLRPSPDPLSSVQISKAAAYDQAAASLRAERALVPYEPSGKQKHYHAAFRLAAGGLLVNAPRSMGLTGEGRELAVHTHDASAVVHLHLPSGSKPFDISQVLAVWGLGEIEGQKLLIKVNGKPAKSSYVLKDRDDVVLYLAGNPTPLAFDWDQIPLDPAK